jgi:hypothetical protein
MVHLLYLNLLVNTVRQRKKQYTYIANQSTDCLEGVVIEKTAIRSAPRTGK